MKISIISTSHRLSSQSKKISTFLCNDLLNIDSKLDTFLLDLAEVSLPLWSPDKKNGKGVWGETWSSISDNFKKSEGFILVVPEYGGMATPAAKNIFLLCGDGEFAHKPGLIVSVSSGNGGSYPISELRSSSYKNTHLMWIPENIIIRNVEQFSPGNQGKDIPDWIEGRLDYSLELLLAYGKYMLPLRNQINRRDFGNGM